MKNLVRALALALSVCLTVAASAQDRRPPTIDDVVDLVQVSGAEISPDGKQIIYTKSELKKWSDNKRVSSIWIANADGSDQRQFLGSDKDRSPAWSPDGRNVAFLSTRDQAEGNRDAPGAQIWLLPIRGGEATKLSEHKAAVRSIRWAEDSSRIFFSADQPQTDAQKEARKNAGDAIFVDEGPNGQGRANYSNLWVITIADKQARQLTTGEQIIGDFEPSPDGSRLVYTRRPNNTRNHQNLAEVFVVDTTTAAATQLTRNQAPENNVAWTPDGKAVTYVAPHDKTWELAQGNLYIHPLEGTANPTILSANFPGDIGEYFWHPSARTIVMSANVRGRGGVYELDLSTGRAKAIAAGDLSMSVSSASKDRSRLAGTRSLPTAPGEIAVVDVARGQIAAVTDANAKFREQLQLSQMRAITWKSKDGLEIEGLLWLPAAYKTGDKLPLLLSLHGGPAGVWSTSFRGINHVYTAMGWAVLEPNVRGSTSYGDALLRGNTKDIGGGDYHDAMTGVDALIAQGIADPNQLAVRGWSYGGILGGWTITQTQRFKAASLGAMVADWSSEYAMGFNHDVRLWYIGGTPWENPEGYRKQSAYTHIHKVTTPTLLLHGENDDTDTIGQSMMFYQGLKDRGIATRFIRFPREPHGFREPYNIRMRDAEEISWLMKYTRGIEWKVAPRKDAAETPKSTTTQ
jgi:dipeptidyl aminopeptidase/acylaminoacyl peptidase